MVAFSEMPKPPDYSELSDSLMLAMGTGRFSGPLHRIGVGLYLLASAAAFYYTYNRLALEHIQQHPEEPLEGTTWTHSWKSRLLFLPFWLWTIIFLIPYLQMFLFFYLCTRADPKTLSYFICNRHQAFVKVSNQISRLQLIDI
uniref:Lysosomal enzyme trafficking factor n=1 Tax=Gorilla gorilla gorilla TaxID=9595 RepID=A0A2I2YJX0_GORGO